jgi:hypothetical protein
MRNPVEEHRTDYTPSRGDWGVALAIALTIAICLAAFIWIFVALEPFLSDFVSEAELASPTIENAPAEDAAQPSPGVP